jgi:hypothetical protein
MLSIIDKGGYQYGDKVTVFYDPTPKRPSRSKANPRKPHNSPEPPCFACLLFPVLSIPPNPTL